MKYFLTASAIIALALSAAPGTAAELVTNGGFENGLFTGWTHTTYGLTGNIVPSEAHTGSRAVRFGSSADSPDTLSQLLATVVGQTYTVSAFFANNNGNSMVSEGFNFLFGNLLVSSTANAENFDYTQVGGQFVATSASTLLSINGYNLLGYTYVDDISIQGVAGDVSGDVPEPATWAMLLVGLGAVGAAQRNRRRHPAQVAA